MAFISPGSSWLFGVTRQTTLKQNLPRVTLAHTISNWGHFDVAILPVRGITHWNDSHCSHQSLCEASGFKVCPRTVLSGLFYLFFFTRITIMCNNLTCTVLCPIQPGREKVTWAPLAAKAHAKLCFLLTNIGSGRSSNWGGLCGVNTLSAEVKPSRIWKLSSEDYIAV